MRKFAFLFLLLSFSSHLQAAGNIEVQTVPSGARIYLEYLDDGDIKIPKDQSGLRTQDPRFQNGPAYAGNSPLRIDMIGIGRFRVVAELDGYEKASEEALVYDEQTTTVRLELNRKLHNPEWSGDASPTDGEPQFTVEISMKTDAGPVPVFTNISEIIYQGPDNRKNIIDKTAVIENKTPPSFSGGITDTKFYIRNLSGNWYVIAQMDEEPSFTLELKVYDAAQNVVHSDRTTGAYEILSVYNWEISR